MNEREELEKMQAALAAGILRLVQATERTAVATERLARAAECTFGFKAHVRAAEAAVALKTALTNQDTEAAWRAAAEIERLGAGLDPL